MVAFSGLFGKTITPNLDCDINHCIFSSIRDGCVRISSPNINISIVFCVFIDNSVAQQYGGALYIVQNGINLNISFCFASFCYTLPCGVLSEGQFCFIRCSDLSVDNLCISQCAPFTFNDIHRFQRASVYFAGGCREAREINNTRSETENYALYVIARSDAKTKIHHSTIALSEVYSLLLSTATGTAYYGYCNFLDNNVSKTKDGLEVVSSGQANYTFCSFVFNFPCKCTVQPQANLYINKCFIKNLNTSNAIVCTSSDMIENIDHLNIFEIFFQIRLTKLTKNVSRFSQKLNTYISLFCALLIVF